MNRGLGISVVEDGLAIREVADDLFVFTDRKDWGRLRTLFVEGPIEVDMSSLLGGGPVSMTASELVSGFAAGLHARKQSHHMATNYRVDIAGDTAELWANGYAWNRLDGQPEIWETWGNYRISFRRTASAWRISAFRYFAKFNRGDDAI